MLAALNASIGTGNMRPGMGKRSSASGAQTPGFGGQSGVGRPGAAGQGAAAQGDDGDSGTRPGSAIQPFGRLGRDDGPTGIGGQRAPGQLIGGVRSKSKARSIRELNGRTRYDQWEFVYVPYNPNPQPPGVAGDNGQQPGTSGQQRPGGARQPGAGSSGQQRPGIGGPPIQ